MDTHLLFPHAHTQTQTGGTLRGGENNSSVGGIFSSYRKHSTEMPQRLMGGFDRRWRDTPVKNSSCLLLLHLFVFLSSSIPSSPPPPHCLFPLLKSHLPHSGSARFLHPRTHEGHHGPLVSRRLQFIPTFPSCLQEAVDRWPVVLLAAPRRSLPLLAARYTRGTAHI